MMSRDTKVLKDHLETLAKLEQLVHLDLLVTQDKM